MARFDKSWMQNKNRLSLEYKNGVDEFLEFSTSNDESHGLISCPCVKCNNAKYKSKDQVRSDLIVHGIIPWYTCWVAHGESNAEVNLNIDENDLTDVDDTFGMIRDAIGLPEIHSPIAENIDEIDFTKLTEDEIKFYKLMKEAEEPLYPGCDDMSKLTYKLNLLQIKNDFSWSNKSFDGLTKFLMRTYKHSKMPKSYYEARKIYNDLGLDYMKIDSCRNHCMLYYKNNAKENKCSICGTSRWKYDLIHASKFTSTSRRIRKVKIARRVSNKSMWYFPLKPRLTRRYMCFEIAKDMRYHYEMCKDDECLRHPADSEAWKAFDKLHPSFSSEPRNVRLGLASDGFNPFGNMSVSYSIWPVILIPYNLPPWLCMKDSNFILSLLIPGRKSPGDNIDIYLQPLVDELLDLWENGVVAYDAFSREKFLLRAAILWTINDFPAYGYLSGWSTSGRLACPSCHRDTCSLRLKNGGKFCFMGHRRFLPKDHKWRHLKRAFNNQKELSEAPQPLSGEDVLAQLATSLGKRKKKMSKSVVINGWRKKSIFFKLPYWKTLLLRHNLDVMHIEKNICESIIGTFMHIEGKTKDNLKARMDLKRLKIREELHPREVDGKIEIPVASYTLTKEEKRKLCGFLKEIKFPDGYCSNISRYVNAKESKISSMKSHDYHIFLEMILPLAVRGILPKHISEAIIELCIFFKELCSKVLWKKDLEKLQDVISTTLCKLETIFPPSFFDVMVHLPIHLAYEAIIGGPVQYRWMYPIERYLKKLKSYVRNKNRPEGSIAEMYIADECLIFCSRYMAGVETRLNRPSRIHEPGEMSSAIGPSFSGNTGVPLSTGTVNTLIITEWWQVHLYVLQNFDTVLPFIREFKEMPEAMDVNTTDFVVDKEFAKWLLNHVSKLLKKGVVDDELLSLVRGPDRHVISYTGLDINGFRFHTEERDMHLTTQSSGVVVRVEGESGNKYYYGVVQDIIELKYTGERKIHILMCIWWDVHNEGRGFIEDKYGFISLNTNRRLKTNEPFVLASQAEQCYYVPDLARYNWMVVVKGQPRNLFQTSREAEKDDSNSNNLDAYQERESTTINEVTFSTDIDEANTWKRTDVNPEYMDLESAKKKGWRRDNNNDAII